MAKRRVNALWRPNIEQTVITSSASSQQSSAFGAQTYCVRLACSGSTATVGVYYSIGFNPTATANSPRLNAGNVEYIGVNPGEKVAILEDTSALKVTITEMTH
jgi:hypothetical protein